MFFVGFSWDDGGLDLMGWSKGSRFFGDFRITIRSGPQIAYCFLMEICFKKHINHIHKSPLKKNLFFEYLPKSQFRNSNIWRQTHLTHQPYPSLGEIGMMKWGWMMLYMWLYSCTFAHVWYLLEMDQAIWIHLGAPDISQSCDSWTLKSSFW